MNTQKIFGLMIILALLLAAAPATSVEAAGPISVNKGNVALSGGFQAGNFPETWDLTSGDLTLSFTYNGNGLVDDAGAHAWAELGIRDTSTSSNFNPNNAGVWFSADYDWTANTFDPDVAPNLDLDDKLLLQKVSGTGEGGYNLPSVPPAPGNNHRFWWDRDGVDPWQNDETANTAGLYNIVMTLHATSATTGTAYMTINGLSQGFETDGNWGTIELTPAGMTFSGNMTSMQVFYGIYGYGATHQAGFQNITVAGFPADLVGPITSNVVASSNLVVVGGSVTVTANVDDTTTGGRNIASAEYSFDGTSWSPMTASDGAFDEVSEDVSANIVAPAVAGIYDLCVRGTDVPGNVGGSECTMIVVYDPSGGFVTGGGWIDSPAGAVAPITALVWNQGFETDTAGWSDVNSAWYGLATRVPSGNNGITSSVGSFHAVFEGDPDSAPFTRFDDYRAGWPGSWTAEIDVYLDPAWADGQGFDYSVAATGSDGNHQRDYIFHVTKDTSTGKLFVAGSNNTNFVPREDLENINHYEVTTAGWYTFQHVFRDQGGALAVDLNLLDTNGSVLFTETRYNAADLIPQEVGGNRYGWFTFINVTGGIAVDEHQLFMPFSPTGKATFGFVSKYKKGASVPDGNTEFQFKAGDLNFHSTSYDWLVVNQGGTNAQFKGSGTINGAGSYQFMIWAGDGSPDTFRIKIWDAATEVVVYDNGMDQPIGGGSIVVKKK